MSVLKGLRAKLRSVFGPRAAEFRMEEEFRFHVEMEAARLEALGQSASHARRQALMAFGGLDQHREAMRDGRGSRWLSDVSADIRYAVRGMRRSPAFAMATALTLGIGVGVNGVTFGFVNSLLLRPIPAHDPEQLLGVFTTNTKSGAPGLMMYEDYLDLRDRSGVFQEVAGRTDGPLNMVVSSSGRDGASPAAADMVWGEIVTENYFKVLGTKPALGRFFAPNDAPQGANQFAVLSYEAWRTRFNRDTSIVGRSIRLNGTDFTVTGVAPKGFRGIRSFGFWPDVWVPLGMHNVLIPGSSQMLQGRGDGWMMVVGRMHKNSNRNRTTAMLQLFARQLAKDHPGTNGDFSMMVVAAASGFDHPAFVKPRVLQLASALGMFAAFMTLLIICANLANLQLARGKARAREIAIRLSLGCSRQRLVRQLMLESAVLAVPGALLAGAVLFSSPFLERMMVPHLQFRVGFNPAVDLRVLVYTAAVALAAVLLFGLVPALRASRADLAPSLVAVVGKQRRTARTAHSLRTSLVVSQLALSVMLLVAGTLFVRSLLVARSMDVGFDPNNRIMMSANPGLQGYDQPRGQQFYRAVLARLRDVPGVVKASWVFPVPFDTYGRSLQLYVDGIAGSGVSQTTNVDMTTADVDFIDALGLRLLSGRSLTDADSAGSPQVMVVSQQFARKFWPGKEAIGQRARVGGASGPELTVVGVVRDARFAMIGERNQERAYLPLRQNYRSWQTLVVHTNGGSPTIIRDVRAAVAAIDPTLPTYGVTSMSDAVSSGFSTNQTAAGIGGFFGLMSMLISTIGLYAVVASGVTERTREIGVRMALGATPRRVVRLVMQGGARMAVAGIAIGLILAAALARSMQGLLYGVSASDTFTFLVVPTALLAVVFLATWLPALRAVRMSPMTALRNE